MALFVKYFKFGISLQQRFQVRPQLTIAKYSVYPPHFREPIYKKQDLDKLYEDEKN